MALSEEDKKEIRQIIKEEMTRFSWARRLWLSKKLKEVEEYKESLAAELTFEVDTIASYGEAHDISWPNEE